MSFERILLSWIEHAEDKGESELTRRLENVAKKVVAALKGPWEDFDKTELTEDSDDAGEAALWLDAAETADQAMVADKQSRIVDVKLGRDSSDNQRHVQGLFASGETPTGGFVYVAYTSGKKSEFNFVGHGKSARALPFSGSSKASNALRASDRLALLFPRLSSQTKLEELESAICYLIRCATGDDPAYQPDVEPEMPDSEAWDRIEGLSDLLESAGVHLYNHAKHGED